MPDLKMASSPAASRLWSFRNTLVFWWVLFLLMQQVERLFLLPETLHLERPTSTAFIRTFVIGFQGDLIIATICILLAGVLAGAVGCLFPIRLKWNERMQGLRRRFRSGLVGSSVVFAVALLLLLTVDMGYFQYNRHHLDFVFFEYLDDLVTQVSEAGSSTSQAAHQTGAELQEGQKWGIRLFWFWLSESVAISIWWLCFKGTVGPLLASWIARFPKTATTALLVGLVMGTLGCHIKGPQAVRQARISSAAYYTLAQNPILYASESLRAALDSRLKETLPRALTVMPLGEAVQVTQAALGHGVTYPFSRYPLVRANEANQGVHFRQPANVVLIFVEGLDRRFLNRTVQGIRVTPFLDRLRDDSLYFDRFFSNGTQTARGLFASLCSYYPRQGTAEMKTRYTHDYLCLPSVLRKAEYRTEMVVGEHRDLNRLNLFMARNGLHQLLDKAEFPAEPERMVGNPDGGWPDGVLFDVMRKRIEALREDPSPWFLTTLTFSTHHPFVVPQIHPDVHLLTAETDGYIAALRYFDLELERFFTQLRSDGLLKDTLFIILGDHGRHEQIGRTDGEKAMGHFMTPLFIWLDDSLREGMPRYPRTVSVVASQIDLAPTILALNGLTPPVAPFLGRDLSCLLVSDCLDDNEAYLTSAYDDSIGLVDHHGFSIYSLRRQVFSQMDFDPMKPVNERSVVDPDIAPQFRRLMALYVSSNTLLEQNRIWSWKDLGGKL